MRVQCLDPSSWPFHAIISIAFGFRGMPQRYGNGICRWRQGDDSLLGIDRSCIHRSNVALEGRQVEQDVSIPYVSPNPQLNCGWTRSDPETDPAAFIHIHICPLYDTSRFQPVVWNAAADDDRAVDLDGCAHLKQRLLREASSPAIKISIAYGWYIHPDPGIPPLVFECLRPVVWRALVLKLKLKILGHLCPV